MNDDQLEEQIKERSRKIQKIYDLARAYGSTAKLTDVYGKMAAEWLEEGLEIWVTKDGQRYKLHEMDTDHIQNSIKMIESRNNWRRHFLIPLKKELAKRNAPMGELIYGNVL